MSQRHKIVYKRFFKNIGIKKYIDSKLWCDTMKTGFFYEAKCRYFWRAVMAEMFAALTFVFVVSALGTKVKNVHDLTSQTLAIGFTAAILVKLFASISGGYFNPAVTVGASTNGEISSLRGTVYAVAQYCGGKSVNT